MKVYFAMFTSPMYHEDTEVLSPGYFTEEDAKKRIEEEVRHYKSHSPSYYQANDWNYRVLELEVV